MVANKAVLKKLNALKNVNGSGLTKVGTMYYNGNGYVLSPNTFPKNKVLYFNVATRINPSPNSRYLIKNVQSNGGKNKQMFANSVKSYLDSMLTVTQ